MDSPAMYVKFMLVGTHLEMNSLFHEQLLLCGLYGSLCFMKEPDMHSICCAVCFISPCFCDQQSSGIYCSWCWGAQWSI